MARHSGLSSISVMAKHRLSVPIGEFYMHCLFFLNLKIILQRGCLRRVCNPKPIPIPVARVESTAGPISISFFNFCHEVRKNGTLSSANPCPTLCFAGNRCHLSGQPLCTRILHGVRSPIARPPVEHDSHNLQHPVLAAIK